MPRFRIHDKSQKTVLESLFRSLGRVTAPAAPAIVSWATCNPIECEHETYIRTVPYRIQYGHGCACTITAHHASDGLLVRYLSWVHVASWRRPKPKKKSTRSTTSQ